MSVPVLLTRAEHSISRRDIPPQALKVLYRLHRGGYIGYLCGGCVRDLLLGVRPRDFDVVTDAHPQQIRHLFRNSRIIGRRFRLVHILFEDEIIETATFRRTPEAPAPGLDEKAQRDWMNNTFGTAEEDAFRRDFTINALYYAISDFSVLDYVGGLEDLRARVVRCIGDPEKRMLEDPVRMLRAVSLSARLDFTLEAGLADTIRLHRTEIRSTPPSRLMEEFLKIIRCGASSAIFGRLNTAGLLPIIFPFLEPVAGTEHFDRFLRILARVDAAVRSGHPLDEPVLVSVLYFPALALQARDWSPGELFGLTEKLLDAQTDSFFPRVWRHSMQGLISAAVKLRHPPHKYRRIAARSYFQEALELARLLSAGYPDMGAHLGAWKTLQKSGRIRKDHRRPV